MSGNYERYAWIRDPGVPASEPAAPSAPDVPSPSFYPPRLNERMRQAHTELIQTFQRAVDCHRRSLFDACIQHLTEFDRRLRSYLGNEEAELEDYLHARLAGDAQHLQVMRQVRARLRQMARQVHEMLQPAHPARVNPARSVGAVLTFKSMQQVLVRCVDSSELELLPYCPADDAWSAPVAPIERIATKAPPEPTSIEIWRKAVGRR